MRRVSLLVIMGLAVGVISSKLAFSQGNGSDMGQSDSTDTSMVDTDSGDASSQPVENTKEADENGFSNDQGEPDGSDLDAEDSD